LRLPDDDSRRAALNKIVDRSLNVAQTEEYIESLLSARPVKERKRPDYRLKDIRPFLNSVTNGVDAMRRSGIEADLQRQETEKSLILTVTIPR
jgi:ParB family chromosome partitioning protein